MPPRPLSATQPAVNLRQLLESYDHNGTLGRLTGTGPAGQEAFFREEVSKLRTRLAEARRQAAAEGRVIEIDSAAVSGSNGGDSYLLHPDGRAERRLEPFPEAERLLAVPAKRPACRPCPELAEARPLLVRCAYNGLWSPSGTNWQPVRTVELTPEQLSHLAGRPIAGCGLVVLAPPRYQSILSDIAALAGLNPTARAEWIDPGIWLEVAGLSALARGWRLEPHQPAETTDAGGWLARQVRTSAELRGAVASGKLRPLFLLEARQDEQPSQTSQPGTLVPNEFDRLVESRTTQRVASPGGKLSPDLLREMWTATVRSCVATDAQVAMPVFTAEEDFPRLVGQSMHQGIDNLLGLLDSEAPWQRLSQLAGEAIADTSALPASAVPRHLRERLLSQGLYQPQEGLLCDRRGRPLDCRRLVKLVRLITRSFGKYFLRFQNTHPLLGVITLGPDEQHEHGYRLAGRLVARLGLLARARGYTSIIKSGPLEISGPRIAGLLAERALLPPGWKPVLTFQVGLPLGPDELVGAGEKDEHDGLSERLLDRRSTRLPLSRRYFS